MEVVLKIVRQRWGKGGVAAALGMMDYHSWRVYGAKMFPLPPRPCPFLGSEKSNGPERLLHFSFFLSSSLLPSRSLLPNLNRCQGKRGREELTVVRKEEEK